MPSIIASFEDLVTALQLKVRAHADEEAWLLLGTAPIKNLNVRGYVREQLNPEYQSHSVLRYHIYLYWSLNFQLITSSLQPQKARPHAPAFTSESAGLAALGN